MGLHKLLKNMEKRPLMYISNYNIEVFHSFIAGYAGGRYERENKEDRNFEKFYHWLIKYYNVTKVSASWYSILLFYNSGSHQEAIEKFFKLYKQWHKEEFGEDAW